MSLDWGAVASVLVGAALFVAVAGMIVQTVADTSMKRRARTATVGAAMMFGGFAVFGAVFPAMDGDFVLGALSLLSVSLLAAGTLLRNRFTYLIALLAIPAMAAPNLYDDWRDGELMSGLREMAITYGVVVAFLGAIFAFVWLREQLQKSKPRRDAHA